MHCASFDAMGPDITDIRLAKINTDIHFKRRFSEKSAKCVSLIKCKHTVYIALNNSVHESYGLFLWCFLPFWDPSALYAIYTICNISFFACVFFVRTKSI